MGFVEGILPLMLSDQRQCAAESVALFETVTSSAGMWFAMRVEAKVMWKTPAGSLPEREKNNSLRNCEGQ